MVTVEVAPIGTLRECHRCGHKWNQRIRGTPLRCPLCRSAYWNKERKNDKQDNKE